MADAAGSNHDKSSSPPAPASASDDKSSPAPAPALASDDKTSPVLALAAPVNKQEQTADIENKYGGLTPKKPLISRDHKLAYFDSADWALCKQYDLMLALPLRQSSNSCPERTAAIESLKPKLTRTPYQPLSPRKPSFASS